MSEQQQFRQRRGTDFLLRRDNLDRFRNLQKALECSRGVLMNVILDKFFENLTEEDFDKLDNEIQSFLDSRYPDKENYRKEIFNKVTNG